MCHYENIPLNDEKEEISDSSDIESTIEVVEEEPSDDHEIENYLSALFTKLCDENVISIEMFYEPEFRIWIRSLIAIGAICGHDCLKHLLDGC